ncbi:MAG TPA: hypothetical protein VJ827_07650 [Rubrobacter sp.]|nr:hypothetical protein [Rubrobacter sp.]
METAPKMLTVGENTRLYKFIRYIEPAVGKADYWIWKGGDVPDGPGAYAFNGKVPDISVVIKEGLFCAAVPNLATAKKWATETRSGVLLGKGYWGPQLSQ